MYFKVKTVATDVSFCNYHTAVRVLQSITSKYFKVLGSRYFKVVLCFYYKVIMRRARTYDDTAERHMSKARSDTTLSNSER